MTLLAIPAVALLILGAALSVAGIGLPLLLAAAGLCRTLVRWDRNAANRWLDAQVPRSRAASAGRGAGSGNRSTCCPTAGCGGWPCIWR